MQSENRLGVFTTLGASNHSNKERELNDYYATDPKAVRLLLENEKFSNNILEPACGCGHISDVLIEYGYGVTSYDLIDRGYGEVRDFFTITDKLNMDIVTNPPYKLAKNFVEHALDIVEDNRKVAMFLRLLFLEGQARRELFNKYPPKVVYVSSSRISCAKGGNFDKAESKAVAFAWFVWVKGFMGDPIIKWIN